MVTPGHPGVWHVCGTRRGALACSACPGPVVTGWAGFYPQPPDNLGQAAVSVLEPKTRRRYNNKVPAKESLTILGKGLAGAAVIASCKPIKDDDDNPPHYAAMEEYVDVVGTDKFYALSERPKEEQPLPTTFEISANGPVLIDPKTAGVIASSAAIQRVVKTPQTYG